MFKIFYYAALVLLAVVGWNMVKGQNDVMKACVDAAQRGVGDVLDDPLCRQAADKACGPVDAIAAVAGDPNNECAVLARRPRR